MPLSVRKYASKLAADIEVDDVNILIITALQMCIAWNNRTIWKYKTWRIYN